MLQKRSRNIIKMINSKYMLVKSISISVKKQLVVEMSVEALVEKIFSSRRENMLEKHTISNKNINNMIKRNVSKNSCTFIFILIKQQSKKFKRKDFKKKKIREK